MECQLERIKVHYESYGSGRPILFLHSWSLDHRYDASAFEPIFENRGGWRRLYLDLPGHGATPGADWIRGQDDFLQIALDFVDALIPGQRFALSGTSAGALTARGIVYRRPNMVDGLILRIPLIVADDTKRQLPAPTVLVEDASFVSTLPPEDVELSAGILCQTPSFFSRSKEIWSKEIEPAQEAADFEFLNPIRQDPTRYGFTFDVDALPNPFDKPSLFICGRQDTSTGYRDAWDILDNYPRATLAILDRADHGIPVEQVDLFQALVNEWLDRVEEVTPG